MATDMDKVIQIKFATFAFITPFLTPTVGSAMDKLCGGGTTIIGAVGNGIGWAFLSAFK